MNAETTAALHVIGNQLSNQFLDALFKGSAYDWRMNKYKVELLDLDIMYLNFPFLY